MNVDMEPLLRELMGAVLRDERRRQGRTLAQVAAAAGISMQHLSDVERGRKDPSSELLAAITGALRVSVPQLLLRAADDALRHAPAHERSARVRPSLEGAGVDSAALGRPVTLELTSALADRRAQRSPGGDVALAARPRITLLSAA